MPHGSHNRFCSSSHSLEGSVDVVNEIIALIDGVPDRFLNAESLQPWLTNQKIFIRVCAEERIPSAHLVELDIKIVRRMTKEPRNIRSTEWVTTDSILEQHVDRALNFRIGSSIVTSPKGSKFLATHEVCPSQNKWSLFLIISLQHTLVRSLLLDSSIGIMHVTVLISRSVSLNV